MTAEKNTQTVPEEQVSPAEDTKTTLQNETPTASESVVEPAIEQNSEIEQIDSQAEPALAEEIAATQDAAQTPEPEPAQPQATQTEDAELPAEQSQEPDATLSTAETEPASQEVEQPADGGNVAVAETSSEETEAAAESAVDFSEEEAALDELAASSPEYDLGENSEEEEQAASQDSDPQFITAGKSKDQLLDMFARLLSERPVQAIRREAEAIKVAFYKIHRVEIEEQKKNYIEAGGNAEDFAPSADNSEQRLKDLFGEYRRRRDEYISGLERSKEDNLKVKQQVIEELKELINAGETVGNTFNAFRELQQRWKDAGPVPQAKVKDLWETYNHHVENFYNYIKINKELRDLDLKRNYEAKVALCEQAEALILEPSIVTAFHKLQKLHEDWRETGPVANEVKEGLWERFREASSRINKQHQEHFEGIKDEQKRNLELKTELCARTEELASGVWTTRKEWNKASDKLLEIQKVWKTIGFAPKKDNAKVYERFRLACDRFFEQKRHFYLQMKAEMEHNLQLKNEICEMAESLKESEEWKKSTDELIELQKRWKDIGPVARRHSDAVWKRFRAACDYFFERKSAHFSVKDSEYLQNLEQKRALLAEIEQADFIAGGFDMIKEFQRRWGEIGFVPIKQKTAIQKEYKEAMDKAFAILRSSGQSNRIERFRGKVDSMRNSGDKRLRFERDRLYNRVKQLESEIALLENNIGFFSNSKNAEAMIRDVRAKIDRAKEEMATTIEKINLIDNQENQDNQ